MDEYDRRIQAAAATSLAAKQAAIAAASDAQRLRKANLLALREIFEREAMPEFTLARDAMGRAGLPASVEIGEVIEAAFSNTYMRLCLTAGPKVRHYAIELRGTSATDPAACRILTPTSETHAGDVDPAADRRDFCRTVLLAFVETVFASAP